jgi:hypothetical protein
VPSGVELGLKVIPWLDRPFITAGNGSLKRRCRTQPRSSKQDCADNHFQSTEPSLRSWHMANSKVADLAGPGIGNYTQLEKVLPNDYSSALTRRETQNAIFAVKRFIEDNLCKELNLIMVALPLIVDGVAGTICWTAMVPARPFSSTSSTITTNTP